MLGGNIACDKLVILETTVRHPYYGESIIDKVGEFTIVGGNVLKKDADIEKDELPVENAMFTVTEKYPTNDPGKYTLTMSATVIKDGKYDAGQNVAVGVVTNA